MSEPVSDTAGWPWGPNTPTPGMRVVVAATIATLVLAAFVVIHFPRFDFGDGTPRMHSDFSLIWYGAALLRDGRNPYTLIGPGLPIEGPWRSLYPATAYVLALPLTLLREEIASLVYVFASSFLLVFGATRDSWHRLPIFFSVPFLTAAILGQWSMLMTAVVFLPWLAFIASAKPQAGIPVVITSKLRMSFAVLGAIPLLAVSLILLPSWPGMWLKLMQNTGHLRAPVANFGGFLTLLVLLRWRRADAWIVLTAAALPQTWFPYNWLLLLALAETYREACVLTLIASIGALAGEYVVHGMGAVEAARTGGVFAVAFAFLPATVMILRRPNERILQDSPPLAVAATFLREHFSRHVYRLVKLFTKPIK